MSLMNKFTCTVISLLLLCITPLSQAAGLGGIDLDSYLNQPLTARIQVLGITEGQIGTISARLASADDYEMMGMDQSRLTVPLTFSAKVWRGKTVIEVTSTTPIKDPILQFAVDVSWESGHLLREYTLFLDPPTVAVAPPRKQSRARTNSASETIAEVPVATITETTTTAVAATEPELDSVISDRANSGARVTNPQGIEYGPVKSGETLWSIVNKWSKQTDYSVNQAMVAIVRLNPEDFVGGDINRMSRGAILRLPTAEDIAAITTREANEIVSNQISAWREQSTQIASTPQLSDQASEPALAIENTIDSAANEAATEIVDDALARISDDRLQALNTVENQEASEAEAEIDSAESDTGGLLELIPPAEEEMAELENEMPGSASGNDLEIDENAIGDFENRLARTEEELVATQEQNSHLAQQVESLKAEVDALRDGININDNELAAVQNQMADTNSNLDTHALKTVLLDKEKSIFEKWWWLGLMLLIIGIAWFVYRHRHNAPAEAQADSNFLDRVVKIKETSDYQESENSLEDLSADAEKILQILEQDDLEVEQEFEHEALSIPDSAATDHSLDAEAQAEEIRIFMDKVEADKAALAAASNDALDYVEDVLPEHLSADIASAKTEILDSLENDDDSESEQALDRSSEDQVEVKLDLARAYLAMQDKPAARRILDEIMLVGSEQQQLEARSMLDEIG